jgi:RNA polymerase sigma-70 factor (ECF subfamily)
LVQETFLHALRARDSFGGAAQELTWMVGILKHKLADAQRARKRREGEREAATAPFDDEGWWAVEPGVWDPPEAGMERREFWETVRGCLSDLPAPVAETFALHELHDVSGSDVCRSLGISPSNLWTRLYRARLWLRSCLERHWFSEGVGGVQA